MTSIEIAEVTGKPHNDVLKAIRKMEPAWEKVHEGKFSLKQRTIQTSNGATRQVPYYSLTKTECLYIATKFNDEARAKLVLRWEQLERERINVEVRMPMPVHCLPTEKAMIAVVDDIRQDLISLENMDARPCYTITEVAMMLNIQRRTLNKLLLAVILLHAVMQPIQHRLYESGFCCQFPSFDSLVCGIALFKGYHIPEYGVEGIQQITDISFIILS